MKSGLTAVLVAMAVLGTVNTASAEDLIKFPGVTTTGNVAITSDYRFRGVSQTSNSPAIQGGLNFNHESGAYVSVWGSSVDRIGYGASAEMDILLGYATKLDLSTTLKPMLDVGLMRYAYFGSGESAPGNKQPDYNEIYAKLGFADAVIKGDSLTGAINYSNEYFNHSDNYWYLSASYATPLADTGLGLVASVGYNKFKDNISLAQAVGGNGNDDNYFDYKVGATFGIQGITGELSWIDNNLDASDKIYDGAVVLTLSKTF